MIYVVDASKINGYAVDASDGRLGTVSDFLVRTTPVGWSAGWSSTPEIGSPGAKCCCRRCPGPSRSGARGIFGQTDHAGNQRQSGYRHRPACVTADGKPSLRLLRMESHWSTGLYMGGYGYMGGAMAASPIAFPGNAGSELPIPERDDDDPHLRSIATVTGYHIHALDGEIGHVEDLYVKTRVTSISSWSTRRTGGQEKGADLSEVRADSRLGEQAGTSASIGRRSKTARHTMGRQRMDRRYERDFHGYYGSFGRSFRADKRAHGWLTGCIAEPCTEEGGTGDEMINPERSRTSAGRRRGWRHVHHSPVFWVGVLLFLAAITIYVLSDDLAWRPRLQ